MLRNAKTNLVLIILVFFGILTGCNPFGEHPSKSQVIIGAMRMAVVYWFNGIENNAMDTGDLDIDFVQVADPKAINELVFTEKVDIGILTLSSALQAIDQGADIKIVGSLLRTDQVNSALVVKRNSTIVEPENLKGKMLGFGSPGSAAFQLVILKELYGIDPQENNVLTKPYPLLYSLLKKEDLDGTVLEDIYLTQAKKDDDCKILIPIQEIREVLGSEIPYIVITAKSELAGTSVLNELLLLFDESIEYSANNYDLIARKSAEEFNLDYTILKETYFVYSKTYKSTMLTKTDVESMMTFLKYAKGIGVLEHEPQSEIFYTTEVGSE